MRLARPHAIEIVFLALATLYSLSLPFKHHITLYDAAVLALLYVAYAWRLSRTPAEEPQLIGPAALLGALPAIKRRLAVAAILLYAALAILASAEPFVESLVSAGKQLGISTFLLVQWIAPLASEAPELIVAALFAWQLNTNAGLGTLVSSKVNQWTLLIGTLPLVFVVAGGAHSGLPLDSLQREELFLTAAQSTFAVAVLSSMGISVREAWMLLGLFLSQFVLGAVLTGHLHELERIIVGVIYLVLALIVLIRQRRSLAGLVRDGLFTAPEAMIEPEPSTP